MKPTKLVGAAVALALLALLIVLGGRAGWLDTTEPTATSTLRTPQAGGPEATGSGSPTRSRPSASSARPSAPSRDPETGLRFVAYASLPSQARETITLIERGGPFPYGKDGATFGNRERLLPDQPRGYYREYTVRTPGEGDRGARRIVTGDRDRVFFYTADHYASFARVRR